MHYIDGVKTWLDDRAWQAVQSEEEERSVSTEEREIVAEAARQVWLESKDKFANALARSLAANMTDSDLAQAVAFYEGPTGSKMAKVVERVGTDMQSLYEQLEPTLIQQFHQHYCEKLPERCVLPDAS